MKKFDIYKTLQFILFIGLTILALISIISDQELFQMMSANPHIRLLGIILWLALGSSFLFIFMDFSTFSTLRKEYKDLDFAVYSDPVSGIANRFSCDSLIEKYLDRPLPHGIGCIMLDLSNIHEINTRYGYTQGNSLIRDFSSILQHASSNLCFVGRNGGNRFLALFEDCTDSKLQLYLNSVQKKVDLHNSIDGAFPIEYRYGIAFDEKMQISTITELISLASRRIADR